MSERTMSKRIVMAAMQATLVVALTWAADGRAQSAPPAPPEPVASSDSVETLRARTAAFWAARVAGDRKGQWELLEPRGRARLTPLEYAPDSGVIRYLGYEVEDATVNGYFATVKVRLLFQPILPTAGRRLPAKTAVVSDQWIRIGGVWYRNLEETGQGRSQGQQQ